MGNLKVALIGLGAIGKIHLENYVRLEEEGYSLKLTAICDVNIEALKNRLVEGNIASSGINVDLNNYNLYSDLDEMLSKEKFDFVDITLPTFLHPDAAVKALDLGINVLCEKPMALNSIECERMVEAAHRNGKKLMVAQCMRFWPECEYLKQRIDNKQYGKVINAFFFRGGAAPKWTYQNWLFAREKSGGVIIDLHVHDIDLVNWLFGKPEGVSTIENIVTESGLDVVSTNYIYNDGKVVNAQAEWVTDRIPFEMGFKVNFEKAAFIFRDNVLKVYSNDGENFTPDLDKNNGYYREIKYFANAVQNDTPINIAPCESTMQTIQIAETEAASAKQNGLFVEISK